MGRTKNPQGGHGWGGLHGATRGAGRSERRERPARKTVADADLQSALLMTKTAASSVVSVREPPAQTSTLHRVRAAAAISRSMLRMRASSSDTRMFRAALVGEPVIAVTRHGENCQCAW